MWLKFLAGVSLLLVSSTPCVVAEQFRVGPVYTDQPGEVSVVVEFESPPGGIPKDAFRLVADGKTIATAQDIKPFKDSDRGLALIICVDVSGTMTGDPLADTRETLFSFFGKAKSRPQDRIALISFADEERIESSFEDTPEHLAEATRNLKTRGKLTRLYQTLYKALDMFEGAELPKRRRVIVISDGKDEGSTESSKNVIDKSTALLVPIDAVGRGKIQQQFVEALQSLAASTGGSFVHARPDRLALADAIEQIYLGLSETRSFVVSFMYERDDAGQMIQNAAIEVQRPGQEPLLSANLLEEIPRLKEKPPIESPKRNLFWLFWLLLAALLGLGFFILSNRRRQREVSTELRQWEDPVSNPIEREVSVPQAREPTVVGGYYFPVPEPGRPIALLIAVSGPLEGQQFSVEKEIFHLGVSTENDLCIAADDYVSENHASLRYEKGSLFIFDRGSKNGTFVNRNGDRIKVSDTGLALSLGDRIEVGMSTFEVARAPSSGRAKTPVS